MIEAVFSEEADRRWQVVRFREGPGEADREKKVRETSAPYKPPSPIDNTVDRSR